MQRYILALVLLLVGPLVAPLQAQTALFPQEPTVQAGDSLNIVVLQEPQLTGTFQVSADGTLLYPLYSDFHVAGTPYSKLHDALGAYLTRFREDPQFTVEPRLPVVVTGEVLEGGLMTFGPGVTIAQAVTRAGLNPEARFDQVQLIRDRKLYTVDFTDPEAQWLKETVRSGDQLIVQRRPNFMRDVMQPVTTTMGAITSLVTFALFVTGSLK